MIMINEINRTDTVKRQYSTPERLNTRISIHDKYSTNRVGFSNWIFSNYRIEKGMRVLELGCGTGMMWKNRKDLITSCSKVILSDFSEGMVETAEANIGSYEPLQYQVIDIQDIPYDDGRFDAVMAHMMLYHVPDIGRALSEVSRVLKDDGCFYCATYGENGIIEYLSKILGDYGVEDHVNKNFTLQNGSGLLKQVFQEVTKLEYADSLAVTDLDDMVEYIYSLAGMTALSAVPRQEIKSILARHTVNGVLHVPKEYGMFIAKKTK